MGKEREKVRRLITKGRKEKKSSGEKREERIGSEEKLRLREKISKESYEQGKGQGKTVKKEGNMEEMEP